MNGKKGRKCLRGAAYKDVEDTAEVAVGRSCKEHIDKWATPQISVGMPTVQTRRSVTACLKAHHGIVCKNLIHQCLRHQEAASINEATVDCWLHDHIDTVQQYSSRDVCNTDKTDLFFQMLPSTTHMVKGDRCVGTRHSKI